jgi:hypothetical protein
MARRIAILCIFAGTGPAGLLAWPALAAPVRLKVSPVLVQRGHTVWVHGTLTACPRGETVTLLSRAFPGRHTFAGVPAVSATVGAHGVYSVTVRIPVRRRPGSYAVTGRCGGGNIGVSVKLRVH